MPLPLVLLHHRLRSRRALTTPAPLPIRPRSVCVGPRGPCLIVPDTLHRGGSAKINGIIGWWLVQGEGRGVITDAVAACCMAAPWVGNSKTKPTTTAGVLDGRALAITGRHVKQDIAHGVRIVVVVVGLSCRRCGPSLSLSLAHQEALHRVGTEPVSTTACRDTRRIGVCGGDITRGGVCVVAFPSPRRERRPPRSGSGACLGVCGRAPELRACKILPADDPCQGGGVRGFAHRGVQRRVGVVDVLLLCRGRGLARLA